MKRTPMDVLRHLSDVRSQGTGNLPLGLLAILLCSAGLSAFGQEGSIGGAVVDSNGGSVANATVQLSVDGRGPDQATQSADDGGFSFSNVDPGRFHVTVSASGFAVKTVAGQLQAGETLTLQKISLMLEIRTNEVTVNLTTVEIAQAQIKVAEKQRVLAVLPNYLASYDVDPAPLNTKQKFELTSKNILDPAPWVINGMFAGIGQAQNTHKGFGQGAEGYAKRYAAGIAEFVTSDLLEHAVMPSIFKQDPRYIAKMTGSTQSRVLYAISRAVVCRGDNKKTQFCYSRVLAGFAGGEITSFYYPSADRDRQAVVIENAAIGLAGEAVGNLIREFVAPKLTRKP